MIYIYYLEMYVGDCIAKWSTILREVNVHFSALIDLA